MLSSNALTWTSRKNPQPSWITTCPWREIKLTESIGTARSALGSERGRLTYSIGTGLPSRWLQELDRRDELARRRAESAERPESHEDDDLFDLSDDK